MHTRFLLVNQRKMSKREGTLFTLEDLKQKGYSPAEVRYLLVTNHYRQPMNFTLEGWTLLVASIARLQTCRDLLAEGTQTAASSSATIQGAIATFEQEFSKALDDDLNVSNALASLYEFVSVLNREKPTGDSATAALQALERADSVIGVLNREVKVFFLAKEELDAQVTESNDVTAILGRDQFDAKDAQALAFARHAARKSKNFGLADKIRDRLKDNGVVFEDTPKGVRIKLP